MSKSPQAQTLIKVIELCDDAIDRCTERVLAARANGDSHAEAWQCHLRSQYAQMRERLLDSIQGQGTRGEGSRESGGRGSAPRSSPAESSGAAG